MRITALVAALVSLVAPAAATLTAAAQAPAQQAQPQAPMANLSGDWTVSATGAKFRSGTYTMKQVNETVIGTNAAGGQLNGTMKQSGAVEGTWRGPTGETGWFTLQMGGDGKSFSGEYGYNGRKAEGKLVGHAGAAEPAPSSSP